MPCLLHNIHLKYNWSLRKCLRPWEELLLCVSSSRELLDGEIVWEIGSWVSVVSSHQLRTTVPRKEAGDLPRTQLRINCNCIRIVLTLECFTLSFDKLAFFIGLSPSVECSGELCCNHSTSAGVGTLKISMAFSFHSATSIRKPCVSFDCLCSLKGPKLYKSATCIPTCC